MPDSLQHYTEAELKEIEMSLKRKADFTIMPINLAAAKLQGIMEDLNMSTTDFATAVSILFVGYLPFQIPSNLILSSITRPGAYICTATIIWGAISAATAAVTTYKSLLAVRVILGAVEAVFFPGVIYLLSSCNAFGGLIAAGILKLDGVHGIRGWRWLFIMDFAVWRLEREAGASEGNENIGTLKGFLLGLQDPKLYAIIFMNMMSQTLLLTAPPYVLAGIVYFGITWYSDRTNNMYRVIIVCICIACATYIIALSTLNTGARYTAMMLMPFSSVGPQLMLFYVLSENKKLDEGGEVALKAMKHGITQQQLQMGWRYEGL
ncbi:unnamed protein product [Aureobasidium vineae]|uniref:MFS general substrate transporter n=1 Tax=Aureobasidium vineae TaxID=2773715 RepID=A0A9N8PEL7_9PEZI|nr:unnamed protein product [Aureobasidium vineae]